MHLGASGLRRLMIAMLDLNSGHIVKFICTAPSSKAPFSPVA